MRPFIFLVLLLSSLWVNLLIPILKVSIMMNV